MQQLWNHSLSNSNWTVKDLLLTILATTFYHSKTWPLSVEMGHENGFPVKSLTDFITSSLTNKNSFVRASSLQLIASVFRRYSTGNEEAGLNELIGSLKVSKNMAVHIFLTDTEAVVRRAILKHKLLDHISSLHHTHVHQGIILGNTLQWGGRGHHKDEPLHRVDQSLMFHIQIWNMSACCFTLSMISIGR